MQPENGPSGANSDAEHQARVNVVNATDRAAVPDAYFRSALLYYKGSLTLCL